VPCSSGMVGVVTSDEVEVVFVDEDTGTAVGRVRLPRDQVLDGSGYLPLWRSGQRRGWWTTRAGEIPAHAGCGRSDCGPGPARGLPG
jgi:hypothetical protein